MGRLLKVSPVTGISLLALFLAMGGTAFAVGAKVAPQPRCAQGAVRGIAEVFGNPLKGIANLGDQFTSDPGVFGRRFNCAGGAVQARRITTGVYQVRFVGNAAATALASSVVQDGSSASVVRNADGSFQVTTRSGTNNANIAPLADGGFTIVVF